jgi:hypothetical protein
MKRRKSLQQWFVLDGGSVVFGPTTCGGAGQFARIYGGVVVATQPDAVPRPPEGFPDEPGYNPPPWIVECRKRAAAS